MEKYSIYWKTFGVRLPHFERQILFGIERKNSQLSHLLAMSEMSYWVFRRHALDHHDSIKYLFESESAGLMRLPVAVDTSFPGAGEAGPVAWLEPEDLTCLPEHIWEVSLSLPPQRNFASRCLQLDRCFFGQHKKHGGD